MTLGFVQAYPGIAERMKEMGQRKERCMDSRGGHKDWVEGIVDRLGWVQRDFVHACRDSSGVVWGACRDVVGMVVTGEEELMVHNERMADDLGRDRQTDREREIDRQTEIDRQREREIDTYNDYGDEI